MINIIARRDRKATIFGRESLMPFFLPYAISVAAADQVHSTQIQTDLEFRSRLEGRSDRDFSRATDDDVTTLLTRIRPGITISDAPWTGRLQVQYTEGRSWTGGAETLTNDFEASLVFAQYKKADLQVTVGRQKIAIGDQRLIGPLEWANRARSFDGIRYQQGMWDAAAFAIGASANRPENARVGYVSTDWSAGKTSYIVKTDSPAVGNTAIHTLDHIWKGRLGELSAEAEAAIQFGEAGGRDHFAYALHASATKKLGQKTSITLEANLASGGSPTGDSRTFDNLYPTNHLFYGAADLVAWKNMQEIAVSAKTQVDDKSQLSLAFHKFWLFDTKDAWYGAGGGINRKNGGTFWDPTGNSGRDIGSEVALNYSRALSNGGNLSLGASLFSAGDFVKSQVAGPIRDQVWFYLSYSQRF